MSKERIDRVICLGDIVGYGAKPLECLDLVQEQAHFSIIGNHDSAALFDPSGFNDAAFASATWTRRAIEKSRKCESYFEFLGELEHRSIKGDAMFVHGSPRRPLDEYVSPHDVFNSRKMQACFDQVEHLSFQGHTHMPGIFVDESDGKFIESAEIGEKPFKFENDMKYMINVGSVGQPRDEDPSASS